MKTEEGCCVIQIGDRPVGHGHPVFLIAEAGVNHNGDLDLAKRLVDAARQAGADAVKFQTWATERLVAADARMADYQRENTGTDQSQYQLLKQLELSYEQFRRLKEHADGQGITFLSTPDEEQSADFLSTINVPAYKVGSGEVTNLPFLRHLSLADKPLILSTGMSSLSEVEAAVTTIEETGDRGLVLLHCVSGYPADPADCNLRAMDTLRLAFSYPVGFSDHTLGISIAVAAVARGACVLEKHLTLDKGLPGPDQRISLDVGEFACMVQTVRSVEAAIGTGRKRPVPAEIVTKQVVQKAIVAATDIPRGKTFCYGDLSLLRTSGGMPPHLLQLVVGRKARRDISMHQPISLDSLE